MLQLHYEKQVLYRGTNREGRNGVTLKRILYLATAALVAMLILVPAALAQDMVPGDDDPLSPEKNVVVLEEGELEQTVGKQIPQQIPDEPIDEPGGQMPPNSAALPSSGGLELGSLLVPAAVLLLGSGVLSYAVIRRRS